MNDLTPNVRIEGGVWLDGENIYAPGIDVVNIRQMIGMVLQRPNPFPNSIYENVAYGPRLYGIHNRHELDEIVEHSLRQAAYGQKSMTNCTNQGWQFQAGSSKGYTSPGLWPWNRK